MRQRETGRTAGLTVAGEAPPAGDSVGCDHGHARHDHDHAPVVTADNQRRTFWAAILTGGFMLAEVAGGLLSGSLALIADAAHMATDSASLALAWYAFRIAGRPADARRTYGFGRMQVLIAFANGVGMVFVVAWIAVEAIERLSDPGAVLAGPMLLIAALGLLVNVVVFVLLHGADRESLNIKGALLHVLGDLLGSVAAIVAAGVILATGWTPIDPLLSLLVALILVRGALRLVSSAGHILLEGTPPEMDVQAMRRDLTATVAGVEHVHHVHAWSLTEREPLVTLHACIGNDVPPDHVTAAIKARLRSHHGVRHSTVQIEGAGCVDEPNSLTG